MAKDGADWGMKMTPKLVASVVPNRILSADAYLIILIDDMDGKGTGKPEKTEIIPHIYSYGFSVSEAVTFLRELANGLDGEDGGDASGGLF